MILYCKHELNTIYSKFTFNSGCGYYDALSCRNRFAKLRGTYVNLVCYPLLLRDTRWPFVEDMRQIIGSKPVELIRQAKLEAKGFIIFLLTLIQILITIIIILDRSKLKKHESSSLTVTTSNNQEMVELNVALLNLVKKYIKEFETERKNSTWDKITEELNSSGFKFDSAGQKLDSRGVTGLFHRLRYSYLDLLR